MSFGPLIKKMRAQKRLSTRELAKTAGLYNHDLIAIEEEHIIPDAQTAADILITLAGEDAGVIWVENFVIYGEDVWRFPSKNPGEGIRGSVVRTAVDNLGTNALVYDQHNDIMIRCKFDVCVWEFSLGVNPSVEYATRVWREHAKTHSI